MNNSNHPYSFIRVHVCASLFFLNSKHDNHKDYVSKLFRQNKEAKKSQIPFHSIRILINCSVIFEWCDFAVYFLPFLTAEVCAISTARSPRERDDECLSPWIVVKSDSFNAKRLVTTVNGISFDEKNWVPCVKVDEICWETSTAYTVIYVLRLGIRFFLAILDWLPTGTGIVIVRWF